MTQERISLSAIMTKPREQADFVFWIVGDTPLITHAWSEKAKREMLSKQVKAAKAGRDAKDPDQDFVDALYEMGDGTFGFPATGVKNCILSAAHKDKGIARSVTMAALWLDAEMVKTRPALAKAMCDMPLVRIWSDKPLMREDMVRVGSGLNKTASLAYRPQFTHWGMRISGHFNASAMNAEQLVFLVREAGSDYGLGEWRNEKKGMFGAFHLASAAEEKAWNAFAAGKGKLPVSGAYKIAAE